MEILGFIENSFIDWDGKISSVIFLNGCNFRCPFCQNYPIVNEDRRLKRFKWQEIKNFLLKHKNWIDGIVLSGGEPLIHPEIFLFCAEIKALGFLIKLDTNGYFFYPLKELINQRLIDYVAMDVKTALDERYYRAVGRKIEFSLIRKSINLLKDGVVDYEFRTTLVPKIVSEKELLELAKELRGAKRWILQSYVPQNARTKGFQKITPYSKETVNNFLSLIKNLKREIDEIRLRSET